MKKHFQAENINTEPECAKVLAEKLIGNTFDYKIVSYDTHSETVHATTEGTIQEWLLYQLPNSKETTFRCLIVSSQPSGFHQLFVAYNTGRQLGFSIEWDLVAISDQELRQSPIKAYLDNIARVFFNLRKM